MACACKSGSKTEAQAYTVALPGGRKKSYRTEIAARAEVQRVPGAYLLGDTTKPAI